MGSVWVEVYLGVCRFPGYLLFGGFNGKLREKPILGGPTSKKTRPTQKKGTPPALDLCRVGPARASASLVARRGGRTSRGRLLRESGLRAIWISRLGSAGKVALSSSRRLRSLVSWREKGTSPSFRRFPGGFERSGGPGSLGVSGFRLKRWGPPKNRTLESFQLIAEKQQVLDGLPIWG